MKKRDTLLVMAATAAATVIIGCGESNNDGPFEPKDNINWVVTPSPGGGSGIYTKVISDVMVKDSLVNGQTIIVTSKTDGSSEIGRNEAAGTKGKKADYTFLTFDSDDLIPMVQNTKNCSSSFRILAVMAVNEQLIFKEDQTQYADSSEAIETIRSGTEVVTGGSKGDNIATYDTLIVGLGIDKDMMTYITYDPTGDTIITTLGGHIGLVISKPAVTTEYMTAGSLIPMLALSAEWCTDNLADAPALSEIGDYGNVEVPVRRGTAAPAAMSDSAATPWSEQLRRVSEINAWNTGYLEKNKLIGNYMDMTAATEYVIDYEKDYMESVGIQ